MGTAEEMTPIETKELKGVSLKLLVWLIASTVTIVASVTTSYITLSNKIDSLQRDKAADDRYNDLRLQTMSVQIQSIQAQVDNIKNDVKANQQRLESK